MSFFRETVFLKVFFSTDYSYFLFKTKTEELNSNRDKKQKDNENGNATVQKSKIFEDLPQPSL